MSLDKEKYSYLHSATPAAQRKRPRVRPFKCSKMSFEKDRRNVYLRIKPKNGKCKTFVTLDEQTLVPIMHDSHKSRKVSQQFKFTKIFGPECHQDDIFRETCTTPLTNFLHGGNCLLFAYGATNAGKTYTIQGSAEKPGIIPRALNLLFNSIQDKVSGEIKFKPDKLNNVLWLSPEDIEKELEIKRTILNFNVDRSKTSRSVSAMSTHSEGSHLGYSTNSEPSVICPFFQAMSTNINDETIEMEEDPSSVYSIWVSYAELYNECVYDLLQPATKNQKPLLMGENEKKEVFIKGLTEVCVLSAEEAYKVFMYGQHNLHQASTSINHVSSRSHSIFSIKLVKYMKTDCPTFARLSMCTFVDLAGAERAKKTKNAGERLKESQSINTSLHVLGKCLDVLRQNQKSKDTMTRMLPCRESKLTRLFQRALEGKEILTMIVNINQDENLFDETVNVLKFSAIAMELEFDRRHDSTVCSLRKSSFSMYMSKLSSTFQSSMEGIEEVSEDSRYMKLLAYIEELKKNVEEEKNKNLTLEVQVRKEAYAHFRKIMVDMDNSYKQRLKDEREAYAEYEEVNANLYRMYLNDAHKRSREDDSEEEEGSDTEDDDYEEKIQFLQNKVEALTGLVEAGEKIKSDHIVLQTKYSKLQFELATVKQELESASKIKEAIGQGGDANDEVIKELKEQLVKHQNMLKERNSEIENLNKILQDAKVEYDEHFKEHEDFAAQNAELEKLIADRDLKIEDLQAQLKICNEKLSEQQERSGAREFEDAEYAAKLQRAREDRDEFMLKVSQLESQINKLQKENEAMKNQPKTPDSEVKVLELLVASHEDQLKRYEEKMKNQEEANKVLEEEVSVLKESSIGSNEMGMLKDSYEKEISMLQAEVKESIKSKKELIDKIETISKELQESKEALKLSEMALTDEQGNTKAMRKICESEKNDLQQELQCMHSALKEVKEAYEKISRENTDLKLLNMELEETVKVKEDQMEDFKSRRDAQFDTYENLLKHERELREREQREVHQMHNVMRTLTPKKNEHLAEIAKLKDELKEAYMKISELNKEKKSYIYDISNKSSNLDTISNKTRTRRPKKGHKENTLDDSLEDFYPLAGIGKGPSFPEKTRTRRQKKDPHDISEDEVEDIPVIQEISIKPDPDSNRQLRPRRKKALYTSEETTKFEFKSSRR